MTNNDFVIALENVHKWYGDFHALNDVSENVMRKEVVVVCGPSGSGKSTLIRTINKLEEIQSGKIVVDGVNLETGDLDINHFRSKIGFVFQQFNLFPHLRVLQNVTLGPRRALKLPHKEADDRAMALLEKVGLASKAQLYPRQLSGGQQQRVAIARALAMRPPIMLFDEPTSALDPELVGEVLQVMRQLAQEGMTMVCVTHEMGFAREVADRIVFMDAGKILVTQKPDEFFARPGHERAARFIADIRRF